jgi:plasmid stability protein
MNESVIMNAKVPEDFHRRVRVRAAQQGTNISEHLRELVARDLGFSSFADYVQFVERQSDQSTESAA